MYEAVVKRYDNITQTHKVLDVCGHTHRDLNSADACVNALANKNKITSQPYDVVCVAPIGSDVLNDAELTHLASIYKHPVGVEI